MERAYPPGGGPWLEVAARQAAAREQHAPKMSRTFIEGVAKGLADRFKAETEKMRGEIQEQLAEELRQIRKATTEHREIRDRQVEQAVQAAVARVERDLRTFVTKRVDRAMADLIHDIGRDEQRKGKAGD